MVNEINNSFGRRISFVKNKFREFIDADDLRSINSTDRKPNKEFKKGRQK